MSADQGQRARAVEETGRSFIVEASAGTGKTTVLTRRILHCVLESGPLGPPVPLSRICAITFTEKAAGEMKVRLRQELERAAHAAEPQAGRSRQALLDLESATISTFHALAVSLLKERPIEAGLDPRFTALDDIQAQVLFREVWDLWLKRALDERPPQLERALRAGLGLEALRSAANTLRLHAHAIRNLILPAPPTDEELREQSEELHSGGAEIFSRCLNREDKLAPFMESALAWLVDPRGDPNIQGIGNKGAAGNWDGGKPTVLGVREFLRDVDKFGKEMELVPVRRVLDSMLRLIVEEFLPEWQQQKRTRGYLDFDDQLHCAHELLSKSPSARTEFQNRYVALLVDEFQDTDPIQWQIIRLLAASPQDTDATAETIRQGRLFIVGDPKQSIYRFRGADIETYSEVATVGPGNDLGLALLQLTANFRSVPAILSFVDEAFHEVMAAKGKPYQPRYLAFGGRGARDGFPGQAAVHLLGDRTADGDPAGSGDDYLTKESSRIVRLIASIPGNREWMVQAGTQWRAPRLRDIAILMPVLTRATFLEDALREAGIPYVLEGGKFYYARSEVCSAILVLHAISNPNDGVALYGALRSVFFGVSDEDLLRAKMAGHPLDYREAVPAESPLHHPYGILRDLHARRHERAPSETLELLLQRTGAREVLLQRGVQSLANLNKLVRTLRSLQGNSTFSEVVELISSMDEEGIAESESRITEELSDAVRIVSIHRAKGLDFPIVIVAGLGMPHQGPRPDFLMDPHGPGTYGISLGFKKSGMQTPGWSDLVEGDRERDEAELTRLLYVALTRARDHLVLSTHTKGRKVKDKDTREPYFEKTRLGPLAGCLARFYKEERTGLRVLDWSALREISPVWSTEEPTTPGDWGRMLTAEYAELDRLIAGTPAVRMIAAVTEAAAMPHAEEAIDPARDRAVRLGLAFHEAMESVDWTAAADVENLAMEAGLRRQLHQSDCKVLREMLRLSLNSVLIAHARRACSSGRRVLRELPFVRVRSRETAEIQEGKIDLLFEEVDGWVLVDYKTDHVPEGTKADAIFAAKYSGQVNAYAGALRALGITVKAAWLLLARTGEQVAIPI